MLLLHRLDPAADSRQSKVYCTVCNAFRKISRLDNEKETLIKRRICRSFPPQAEASQLLHTDLITDCCLYEGGAARIFSPSLVLALDLVLGHTERNLEFHTGN